MNRFNPIKFFHKPNTNQKREVVSAKGQNNQPMGEQSVYSLPRNESVSRKELDKQQRKNNNQINSWKIALESF